MKKILLGFAMLFLMIFGAVSVFGQSVVPSNYVAPADGQLVPLATSTVLNGVKAAIAGQAGTMILVKDGQYLFYWQYQEVGGAFWGINMNTAKAVDLVNIFKTTGNLANAKTSSELIQWMRSNGWELVSGSSVSPLLVSIVNAGKIASSASETLGLFMVVPIGTDGQFLDWFHRYDVQSNVGVYAIKYKTHSRGGGKSQTTVGGTTSTLPAPTIPPAPTPTVPPTIPPTLAG